MKHHLVGYLEEESTNTGKQTDKTPGYEILIFALLGTGDIMYEPEHISVIIGLRLEDNLKVLSKLNSKLLEKPLYSRASAKYYRSLLYSNFPYELVEIYMRLNRVNIRNFKVHEQSVHMIRICKRDIQNRSLVLFVKV